MWMLLPMVSLLIRAIIGNPQIDENTLSVIIGLGNETNNFDKSSNDIWKRFKGESLRETENAKRINHNTVEIVSEGNDNVNIDKHNEIVSKKMETARSWFELSTRNQGIRKVSQEKASPWLYSSEDRRLPRIGLHGSSISCICKQLCLPSTSKWIDKREKEYSQSNVDSEMKRRKVTYDGYGRDTAVDEFNGIKRVAKMRKVGSKTPFNSWGGKRAKERSIDPNYRSHYFSNRNKAVSPAWKNAGEIDYEKHAIRMRNGISAIYQNWNRKRKLYPYPIPFRIYNETNEHDYRNDHEVNGITDWLIPIHDKKFEQHGQYKKTKFNPWGGKRSSKSCTFWFGNNYFTTPAYAETGQMGFPSTTGREHI